MTTLEIIVLVVIAAYGLWRIRHVIERMSR
jgi:hypothetical protein